MAFSTKIKGHHHLQGNVQVYIVRIPALAYLVDPLRFFGSVFSNLQIGKCPNFKRRILAFIQAREHAVCKVLISGFPPFR